MWKNVDNGKCSSEGKGPQKKGGQGRSEGNGPHFFWIGPCTHVLAWASMVGEVWPGENHFLQRIGSRTNSHVKPSILESFCMRCPRNKQRSSEGKGPQERKDMVGVSVRVPIPFG